MHAHGTAVLDRPAEATRITTTRASARDRWVAKCESQLASALATGNADLLPVIAHAVFLPQPERSPDCRGTGYTSYDNIIEPCQCIGWERPAYDFRRHAASGTLSTTVGSPKTQPGQAEVWTACPCGIPPAMLGPYDGDDLLRVPWVPDCPACNDTGWVLKATVPEYGAFDI